VATLLVSTVMFYFLPGFFGSDIQWPHGEILDGANYAIKSSLNIGFYPIFFGILSAS